MAKYDFYNLSDDVLFLSKKNFYDFVVEVCGEAEADLLQIQGIQSVQSFIRCTNYFSILNIDCEEVDELKSIVCFRSRNGDYVIKQGIQLNLDNLFDVLKEKHDKHKKKKKFQPGLPADNPSTQTTNSGEIITDSINSSNVSSFAANSNHINCQSVYDHIQFIQDLLEKFSHKTYLSTVLKNDEHYYLTVTQNNEIFKAFIKCQCGTKLMLPSRTKTKTFILSNYYAHLTTSNCSMINRILKQEKTKNNNEIQQSSSSSSDSSTRTNDPIDSAERNTNSNKRQKKRKID